MTRSQAGVREMLEKHDLLFSVGGDMFSWSLPSKIHPMPTGLPLIHLDTDPWQIGKSYPAQVGIFDMLRVELSPNGAFNVPEFGSSRTWPEPEPSESTE